GRRAPAGEGDDAQRGRGGQKHQREGSGRAGRIPVGAWRDGQRHGHSGGSGHAPTRTTDPPRRTRRAGSPSPPSQSVAASPRTSAAVVAMLASTHDAAATLTVRQTSVAERPVDGSTTWCAHPSPVSQRRTVVL